MSTWDPTPATAKQVAYILRLAGVQELRYVPGLNQRQRAGYLHKNEAAEIIDTLLDQQKRKEREAAGLPEPTPADLDYRVVEYRTWVDNKHAPSGRSPSTARQFTSGAVDSSDIRRIAREYPSLIETVWEGHGCPDEARIACRIHQAVYKLRARIGGQVHAALLHQVVPKANPMRTLLVDITLDDLRTALGRKDVREGWVAKALRGWAADETLMELTPLDTAAGLIMFSQLRGANKDTMRRAMAEVVEYVAGLPEEYPVPWLTSTVQGMATRVRGAA